MAALKFGTLTVQVLEMNRLPDERGGGGLRRTLNGQLRARTDWVKRAWVGSLRCADATELAAVLAKANPDADVAVSGTVVGASATARVSVAGDTQYVRTATGWFYRVPVSIREV